MTKSPLQKRYGIRTPQSLKSPTSTTQEQSYGVKVENDVVVIPFQSKQGQTAFAPQWNYFIAELMMPDIDINSLKDFLLSKEDEVLSENDTDSLMKGYVSDKDGNLTAGTTNALGSYNLFNWDNSEIKKLKDSISEFHKQYCVDCLN